MIGMVELGVKPDGDYVMREKAAHWDGRNELGEAVASGVYFHARDSGGGSMRRWRRKRSFRTPTNELTIDV